ncbi:hypothetical protein FrCorBMG51_16735 [Protofrankia coriariae]|uniref:Uncharacterized protein n=1 Tax=Protofrankia coriariae TaxID=1562887 RepID=A0ABR5F1N6_9ACTN|nr:hypothetical protein FrCorBMG51_16735 [Protofrankia coriariae]
MPFQDGMALGVGINDLNGAIGAVQAVTFADVESPTGDLGAEIEYETRLINSSEQLMSSLGVTVSAEGRYGLFQSEGKFDFAERSRFNSQSTFLVARTYMTTGFQRIVNPQPTDDAKALVADGRTDRFRERYGDLFINGIRSGGEYLAVISITSQRTEDQSKLAVSLKASFDGIAAGGSVDASLKKEIEEIRSRSEVRVSTYQRGGTGDQVSYTATLDQVNQRLATFPIAVEQAPKAIYVLATPYSSLIFPSEPSWFDLRRQQEVLQDGLRKRLQLLTLRNDIELVLLHPEYFQDPPTSAILSGWSAEVTRLINALDDHVSRVVDSVEAAEFFALALPDGLRLPQRQRNSGVGAVEAFLHADYLDEWQGIPGRSQKFPPGWYDDARGQMGGVGNDSISAFKVPEGLVVRCYEHAWFQGRFIDFAQDTPTVPMEWNDTISSLVVYEAGGAAPFIDYVVALDFAWGRPLFLKPGRYDDLSKTALGTATISVVLVPRGLVVRLFDQVGLQGERLELVADTLDLGLWNNRAASLEVLLESTAPVG